MKLAALQSVPLQLRQMLSLVGISGLATLNLVAVALVIRRLIDSSDTSAGVVIGVGLSVVLLCVALRELATSSSFGLPSVAIGIAGTASILLTCVGLSIPKTSIGAVSVVWFTAVVVESVYWMYQREMLKWRWAFRPDAASDEPVANGSPANSLIRPSLDGQFDEEEETEATLDNDVLSQLTRSRTETGGEAIYGLLRAEFTVGERQHWLNVAFCPPLPSRPTCTAHFVEESEAILEVEEVETYGARLMVRLPEPVGEPRSIVVEMIAESSAT